MPEYKKVTGEDLLPLIHNVLNVSVDNGGDICFSRFSQMQADQYFSDSLARGVNYLAKSRASANITLDFFTDSTVFGLSYSWDKATGHDYSNLDFYLNGTLTYFRSIRDKDTDEVMLELPVGLHRVTLFFPWQVSVRIHHLFLGSEAVVIPLEKRKRILAYGDSITQGYICRHPSMNYLAYLTRTLDAECLNQAVGGYWFEKSSLDPALVEWKPDVITVAYGTNDYMKFDTLAEIEERASGYLEKLTGIFPNIPILGILPICRYDADSIVRQVTTGFSLSELSETLRAVYLKVGITSALEASVFNHAKDLYSPDMVHPNDLGSLLLGTEIQNRLQFIS